MVVSFLELPSLQGYKHEGRRIWGNTFTFQQRILLIIPIIWFSSKVTFFCQRSQYTLKGRSKILRDKLAHTFCMQSINNAGSHQMVRRNHLTYILFFKNIRIPLTSTLQLKRKFFAISSTFRVTLSLNRGLYNVNPDLWGKEVYCSLMAISPRKGWNNYFFKKYGNHWDRWFK